MDFIESGYVIRRLHIHTLSKQEDSVEQGSPKFKRV